MKKVFIVILNWNRADETMECVTSLDKCQMSNVKCQIIIVDNGSVEKLKIKNEKLKIIENKENLGFAEGNNVGVRYALENDADYLMILNNDTLVEKNLIINFLEATEKYKDVGIFSPKIYFAPGFEFHKNRYKASDLGRVIWSAGGNIDWNNVYGNNLGVDEVDLGQFDKPKIIDFAPGTCMFIRRNVFEKLGLFDEKYFLYYEDVDFCVKAAKLGFRSIYWPKSIIWHKVAGSSAIGSDLNDYFITRNRLLFGSHYASLRTKFALLRESVKLLLKGRKLQRIGVRDFYLRNLGKGSWPR